jgi:hypothetical protein
MNEDSPIPAPDSGPADQAPVQAPPPIASDAPPIASTPEVLPVNLTADAQHYLSQTGPWVRFLSIMLFVGAAFMILAGISMVLMGLVGLDSSTSPFGSGSMPSGMAFLLGPVYVVIALLLYTVPGIFLFRYASAIKALKLTPSAPALEDALRNQKTFWRYLGIMAIVMLAIFVLAVMAAIFFAIILSLRR